MSECLVNTHRCSGCADDVEEKHLEYQSNVDAISFDQIALSTYLTRSAALQYEYRALLAALKRVVISRYPDYNQKNVLDARISWSSRAEKARGWHGIMETL